MKTKIIYISGNEVFEMSQIRAAFEEVRSALGLDNDTILFGVPVDCDNALANTCDNTKIETTETITTTIPQQIIEPTPEIIPDITPIVVEEAPVTEQENIEQDNIVETAVTPDIATETPDIPADDEEKVIPILSILGNSDTNTPDIDTPAVADIEEVEETPAPDESIVDTIEADATDAIQVSITDIVTEEAPVAEQKKTLEELLESMEPLGEDEEVAIIEQDTPDVQLDTEENADFSISMTDDMADTDATLAQLANEFAQTQDKIPDTPKPSGNGKIGKLKNILPFKKAKRDDSGLMGDLFGWAGIAANDEDFSIPGFFTSAGGQK